MSQRIARVRPKTTSKVPRVRRVLLLEDHDGSRFVMRQAFASLGYECRAVGNTNGLLQAVTAFDPDVIIYEWATRGEQRLGLSHQVREQTGRHPVVVIVLSAVDEPPGFRASESIDAYLTKPMNLATLESLIRRHGR
jgi:DNA-binding response OmpR family regulator